MSPLHFRDLWKLAANRNNGPSALYVVLTSMLSRSGSLVRMLFKSPAVREHGAREAIP